MLPVSADRKVGRHVGWSGRKSRSQVGEEKAKDERVIGRPVIPRVDFPNGLVVVADTAPEFVCSEQNWRPFLMSPLSHLFLVGSCAAMQWILVNPRRNHRSQCQTLDALKV